MAERRAYLIVDNDYSREVAGGTFVPGFGAGDKVDIVWWNTTQWAGGDHSIFVELRCTKAPYPPHASSPITVWIGKITITVPGEGATVNCTSQDVKITGSQLPQNCYVREVLFHGAGITAHSEIYYTSSTPLPVDANGNLAETLIAKWDTLAENQETSSLYVRVGHKPESPISDSKSVIVYNCTGELYYVGAVKVGLSGVTGIQADVRCVDVTLCNEGEPPPSTHSAAHMGVSRWDGSAYKWSETGWAKSNHHWEEPPYVRRRIFCTAHDGQTFIEKLGDVDPGTGNVSNYRAEIASPEDLAAGKWSFYYAGSQEPWWSITLPGWRNVKGTQVGWEGEVYRKGTDMPGKAEGENWCLFSNCQYRVDFTSYTGAQLTGDNMYSGDYVHWRYLLINPPTNNFRIWDVYPLG